MAWAGPMGSSAIKASLGARGPGGAITLTAAEGPWEQDDAEGPEVMENRAFSRTIGLETGFVASSSP